MPPITRSRAQSRMIGDLSKLTGVKIDTIRYYEKIGLLPAPPRSQAGRRVYGPAETRTLAFIRRARQLGFTLADIRALLALGGPEEATCPDVCSIAGRHVADIRAKIADLRKLELLLSSAMAQCSGMAVRECAVLDALCPEASA